MHTSQRETHFGALTEEGKMRSGKIRNTLGLLEGTKHMPFEANNGIRLGAQKKLALKQSHSGPGTQRIKVCRVHCGQKKWCPA